MLPVILVVNPQYGKAAIIASISLLFLVSMPSIKDLNIYLQQPSNTVWRVSTGIALCTHTKWNNRLLLCLILTWRSQQTAAQTRGYHLL